MQRKLLAVVSILSWSMVVLTGCPYFKAKPTVNSMNPMKRVAILPLQNDTTDVEAPEVVRRKMVEVFRERLYNVMPEKEVDRLLRDKLGVTLGGQLKSVEAEKVGTVLGVDGVLYGTLMDFSQTTVGVYSVNKVRARFQLLKTDDGEIFWENGLGVKSETKTDDLIGTATDVAADISDEDDSGVPWETLETVSSEYGALENLAFGLGKQLVEKATDTTLSRETEEMARRVTESLPVGPGL